jgi:transposase InsO family protein
MDDGCNTYAIIEEQAARKAGLLRFRLSRPVNAASYSDQLAGVIKEAALIKILDVGGGKSRRVFAYIVPKIVGEHQLILGRPWRIAEDALVDSVKEELHIKKTGVIIRNKELSKARQEPAPKQLSANSFQYYIKKANRNTSTQIFAISTADIDKALRGKPKEDPKTKLPSWLQDCTKLFDRKEADSLPPHRPGIDHRIELETQDGTRPVLPASRLYRMSREMLLILRKTLTELLDKGFIRVSNSPAAAPVLFVKKPGGGLRFCVDYRALNAITRKDRYPLPLIQETLGKISKAQWFTKLDIIAAFNRIRMAPGHEHFTAFATHFGLFEWLVTPFGLAGGPSTFQRYVNKVIEPFMDFASAYVDDILIFTAGSLKEHQERVRQVLKALQVAGLQLDVDKCEFAVQSTKYLGFVIDAGKGYRMDPEKVKAIQDWERPTTIKGARGFLGFANFYRDFIKDFSRIVRPIHNAINRKEGFKFDEHAVTAFEYLKRAFIQAPALANYDPEKETVVDCDASGYVTGGVLMQYDSKNILRPVAFYSKKMTPAECNYPIHDKELLAIVRALERWKTELKPLRSFLVRTDHKNLRYFAKHQALNERQARWASELSEYRFRIEYIKGSMNSMADALSRRDQDMPKDATDDRLTERVAQILKPSQFVNYARIMPVTAEVQSDEASFTQWEDAAHTDETYQGILRAVKNQERSLPVQFRHLKLSITDLAEEEGRLRWRDRLWVPDSEPLRTALMQEAHDAALSGHPGSNQLKGMLSRKFFWPGLSSDVARFVKNCQACGRNTVWRGRKQGLLKPLPVPDRMWSEISIDYVTDLPLTRNGHRHVLVVVDRLTKHPLWIPVKDLEGETLARALTVYYIGHHALPTAITSDRGSQFVQGIWGHLCKILGIKQRLSTAYHPETDGSTERMNQVLEEYLRHFCSYYQDDWDQWLPIGQIAIAARDSASTGLSPFFMSHGYHPNLGSSVVLPEPISSKRNAKNSPVQAAEAMVKKIQECVQFAQAAMASAQERQCQAADKKRDPAPRYQPGDKVWLDMRNIKTDAARKRKLCEQHRQFTVIEAIGPNATRLNTPPGIHNVFNNSLLRHVANNPFPSQQQTDTQPAPIVTDGHEQYDLEEILNVRTKRGRGRRQARREYLCRWTGYADPTWEPEEYVKNTIAMEAFKANRGQSGLSTKEGVL